MTITEPVALTDVLEPYCLTTSRVEYFYEEDCIQARLLPFSSQREPSDMFLVLICIHFVASERVAGVLFLPSRIPHGNTMRQSAHTYYRMIEIKIGARWMRCFKMSWTIPIPFSCFTVDQPGAAALQKNIVFKTTSQHDSRDESSHSTTWA